MEPSGDLLFKFLMGTEPEIKINRQILKRTNGIDPRSKEKKNNVICGSLYTSRLGVRIPFRFYFVPEAFVNCHVCHVSASPLPKRAVWVKEISFSIYRYSYSPSSAGTRANKAFSFSTDRARLCFFLFPSQTSSPLFQSCLSLVIEFLNNLQLGK